MIFPLKESRPPLSYLVRGFSGQPRFMTPKVYVVHCFGFWVEYECCFVKVPTDQGIYPPWWLECQARLWSGSFWYVLMWICLVFADRRGGCSNVQTSGFCQTGGKGRASHFLPSTYHWSHRMGNPQESPGINGQCLITGGLLASCRCFFSKKGGYPISRRGMGFIDTLDTSMVKLMSTDCKPTGIKSTFVFVGVEMRAVYILYIYCIYL